MTDCKRVKEIVSGFCSFNERFTVICLNCEKTKYNFHLQVWKKCLSCQITAYIMKYIFSAVCSFILVLSHIIYVILLTRYFLLFQAIVNEYSYGDYDDYDDFM